MADRAAALARSTLKKQLRLGKRTLQQLITDTENTRNKIKALTDERRAINAQIIDLKARRVAEQVDESIETQIYALFRRRDEIDQELAPLRKSIGQLISMLNAWNTFFTVLPNDQEKPDNWDSILDNLKKQEEEEGPEPEASSEGLSSFEGSSVLEEEGNLSDLVEIDDAEAEPYEKGTAFIYTRKMQKKDPKRKAFQEQGEERESDELADASWSYSYESLPSSGSGSGSGSGGEEEEEESSSQSGSESMSPGGTPPGTPPPPRKRWQQAVESPAAPELVRLAESRLTNVITRPNMEPVRLAAYRSARSAVAEQYRENLPDLLGAFQQLARAASTYELKFPERKRYKRSWLVDWLSQFDQDGKRASAVVPEYRRVFWKTLLQQLIIPSKSTTLPVRIVPERQGPVVTLPTPARVLPTALSSTIFPSPEEYEANKKPGMPASSYEQQMQIVRTWLNAIEMDSGLLSDEALLDNFRQFFDEEEYDTKDLAKSLFRTIFYYAKTETIGTRDFNDFVLTEPIFLGDLLYEGESLIRDFLAQFEKKPKLVVPPPAPAGKGKEELSEEAPPPSVRAAPAEQPQAQAEAIATPLMELLSQPHNRDLLETAFNMARDAALPSDLAQQKKVAKSLPTNLDAALQKFEPFTKAKSTYTISAVVGYLTQSFKSPNKEANVAFWKALLGFIYNQLMPAFKFINTRFVNFDGWRTKLQSFPSGETLATATYHWLVWEWFAAHAPSDEPTAQDFARAFQSEQQIWSQVFGVRVVSEASLSSSESRRVPTKQRRTVPEEPAMIPVSVPEPAAAAPQVPMPNKWEQFLGRFNATEEQVRRMLLWTFEGDETTANRLFDFIRNKAATAADPLTLELDDRIMKVLVNASQVDQFEKREQEELERQRKVPKTKFARFLERYGTTVRKLWAYLREYGDADELRNRQAMNDLLRWVKKQPDVETAVPSDDWVTVLTNSSQIELVEQLVEAALPSVADALIGCNACGKAKPKTQSSCCNGKMRYCGQACADRHWNAGHKTCCTGPARKQ
jgi:FMN phosphatase YigB (HAD superfamily)